MPFNNQPKKLTITSVYFSRPLGSKVKYQEVSDFKSTILGIYLFFFIFKIIVFILKTTYKTILFTLLMAIVNYEVVFGYS
jgi:hypothetical protein